MPAFGLTLTQQVAADRPRQNIILSPLSVALALSMAEAGASGQTRTAIRQTLGAANTTAIPTQLRQRTGIDLRLANALWSDRRLPLAPAYIARCRQDFDAEANSLDFHNAHPSADIINAWVSEKTAHHIPKIVSARQVESARAILTNGLYFQARWLHPFSPANTRPLPFHLADGTTKDTPFLHQSSLKGAYRKGPNFEAAELPYGQSGIALYAILPTASQPPEAILATLNLDTLIHTKETAELDLQLPRLNLDGAYGLKGPLTKLGMGIAFRHPEADFSPMGSRDFFLGDVIHNTRLEIDEQGTVAAAATAIVAPTGAAPTRVERKRLTFDRPFAFLLLDHATRTLLFTGVIYQP